MGKESLKLYALVLIEAGTLKSWLKSEDIELGTDCFFFWEVVWFIEKSISYGWFAVGLKKSGLVMVWPKVVGLSGFKLVSIKKFN